MGDMLTMNSLGDGSTLSLDFTTMGGVLDPRLTFTRASTVATYINSSGYVATATTNVPRFDYSPTTIGEPKGLLIEGQGINTLVYSQRILVGSGGWFYGGAGTQTTTPDYSTGPDGVALSASRLQLGFNCSLKQLGGTNGTNNTVSIWAKSNNGLNQNMAFWTGSSASNKVITTQWQRFEAVVNFASSTAFDFYKTDAGDCDILIWGAQLEVGSGASSYIPTVASQVTRAVDTAIIAAGTNFSSWYTGGTTGTFVSNWYGSASSTTARSVIATSDVDDQHLHMYQTPSALTLRLADYTALATVTTANSLTANALTKGAFSYASTATSLCLNGGTVATGTIGFSVAPTFLSIGGPSTTGTTITDTAVMLNNSIRTLKYFPARLSDAQIKEITT
jgi:hypothetical protein